MLSALIKLNIIRTCISVFRHWILNFYEKFPTCSIWSKKFQTKSTFFQRKFSSNFSHFFAFTRLHFKFAIRIRFECQKKFIKKNSLVLRSKHETLQALCEMNMIAVVYLVILKFNLFITSAMGNHNKNQLIAHEQRLLRINCWEFRFFHRNESKSVFFFWIQMTYGRYIWYQRLW